MTGSATWRRRAVVALGAPALLVLAACGGAASVDAGGDDDDGDGGEVGGDMAELMFDADWALEGTADWLLGAGYEFGRLSAHFEACEGQFYRYGYRTSLRAPDGAAFTASEVEALRADLGDAGWEEVDPAPSVSLDESGWPITSSRFEFAEISLVVDDSDEASDEGSDVAAAMTMETECAAATDREIELFEAMGEWEPVRRLPDPSVPPTAD